MKINKLVIALFATSITFSACGESPNKSSESESEAKETMTHAHEKSQDTKELTIPEGARVFFANIQSGDVVNSPVSIQFGIDGMEVEPAGELNQGKGHHHLIITGGAVPAGTVVPADSVNIHYGQGQTETEIELAPGQYLLTMQFADGYHQSYGEQMSETIEIVVE